MNINFSSTNAEIILNEFYEISKVHKNIYLFEPNTKYLVVPDEMDKIMLRDIVVQADNILEAMENFISTVTQKQWEVIEDEH